MTAEEFLTLLQIADLTRNVPELKSTHDFCLKQCKDHQADVTARVEMLSPKPEPDKAKPEHENLRRK